MSQDVDFGAGNDDDEDFLDEISLKCQKKQIYPMIV